MELKTKKPYAEVEELRDIMHKYLKGKKFILDCGHKVTFGEYLGNDVTIINGKVLNLICGDCWKS